MIKLPTPGSCIRVALTATLLASGLMPSITWSQGLPASVVPYGLSGTATWQENIALGIDVWRMAHERARAVLLLNRCSALDRSFPERPAPAMVAASTEVFRWMTGEAYATLPPEPTIEAMRKVTPVLAKYAFNANELAAWEAWRNSPEGQRGLALREVESALAKVADSLVDANSGRFWSWPLARLVRLTDAHGLRAEVDAAFEALDASAPAQLRKISLVPGETPANERLLNHIGQSGKWLSEHFTEHLTPPDRRAYVSTEKIAPLERWQRTADALRRFGLGSEPAYLLGNPAPATVSDFCDSAGLPACQPEGELYTAISAYRTAIGKAIRSNEPMDVTRQIVRGLPASGCP